MSSCPCGDISHEPDRNNKSLLTVYLMAFCSRLTCTLPASISFFRAAMSAVLCAACAADACFSCLYCPCRSLYCPCRLLYLPSRSLYLPCETQPARRTEAPQSRSRTRRFRLHVIMVRSPSWYGKDDASMDLLVVIGAQQNCPSNVGLFSRVLQVNH